MLTHMGNFDENFAFRMVILTAKFSSRIYVEIQKHLPYFVLVIHILNIKFLCWQYIILVHGNNCNTDKVLILIKLCLGTYGNYGESVPQLLEITYIINVHTVSITIIS